jgi:hypothetical protein
VSKTCGNKSLIAYHQPPNGDFETAGPPFERLPEHVWSIYLPERNIDPCPIVFKYIEGWKINLHQKRAI